MPYLSDEDLTPIIGTGSVHDVSKYGTRKKKAPVGFRLPPPKTPDPPQPKPEKKKKEKK